MRPIFLANVVVDTFLHGGIIMWPLLALSLFAIGVITERIIWWTAAKRHRDTDRLAKTYEALAQGDREGAIKLAEASEDPRLRVIAHGLVHPGSGVEIAIQVRGAEELRRARRFLNAMDTIITLAPLLGLLGTVTGIMQSFKFVGGDQELAAAKVSGGIGEALIATACGLGIAIATLLPFNLFGGQAEELREELETVGKNVELLTEKSRPHRAERNYEVLSESR
jgi:biopolymer transport protein ExbB